MVLVHLYLLWLCVQGIASHLESETFSHFDTRVQLFSLHWLTDWINKKQPWYTWHLLGQRVHFSRKLFLMQLNWKIFIPQNGRYNSLNIPYFSEVKSSYSADINLNQRITESHKGPVVGRIMNPQNVYAMIFKTCECHFRYQKKLCRFE